MPSYWIMIFNQQSLGRFSAQSLLSAIKKAHFNTLCKQYGLDPALIQPAVDSLTVEMAAWGKIPLFLVRYGPQGQPPIVVTERDAAKNWGLRPLLNEIRAAVPPEAQERLLLTRVIYSVELVESQLRDMGLVLAYELARWMAGRGAGIVLGLDGCWYRLNPHQAYILL